MDERPDGYVRDTNEGTLESPGGVFEPRKGEGEQSKEDRDHQNGLNQKRAEGPKDTSRIAAHDRCDQGVGERRYKRDGVILTRTGVPDGQPARTKDQFAGFTRLPTGMSVRRQPTAAKNQFARLQHVPSLTGAT